MSLRINKLLSDTGIGSRREVEKYIVDGRVMLNGEPAELTDIVVEGDVVTLDGEELPVDDLLREAASMKHYLEAQYESQDAREGRRNNPDSRSHKAGPRRMRNDRYGEDSAPQRKGGASARGAGGKKNYRDNPNNRKGGELRGRHGNSYRDKREREDR